MCMELDDETRGTGFLQQLGQEDQDALPVCMELDDETRGTDF